MRKKGQRVEARRTLTIGSGNEPCGVEIHLISDRIDISEAMSETVRASIDR